MSKIDLDSMAKIATLIISATAVLFPLINLKNYFNSLKEGLSIGDVSLDGRGYLKNKSRHGYRISLKNIF